MQAVKGSASAHQLQRWIKLLRWDKPSGRLILLIPAGWSLWLAPSAPPDSSLVILMVIGGIAVSGAGCIVNDLWDQRIDRQVARTSQRPLAQGSIQIKTAINLFLLTLLISLIVVVLLPKQSVLITLKLAVVALVPILIYPSSKRWFAFPQALLALCWGFAVLIPWAASETNLNGGLTLFSCWLATLLWTFSFDTVYAMADMDDDKILGLRSSALTLGQHAPLIIAIGYGITGILIAVSAHVSGLGWSFWPFWLISTLGMQRETWILNQALLSKGSELAQKTYGNHFQHQVQLGSLMLLGIIVARSV